ncbi:RNA polymerase II transcription elongation factor-domain-containing protein [Stachybotrys elegans]|uniref:RNA polymerase II transcription elongation factor-domain-containing protein n=1 Tax=Stachybotrys elegans TaxID=80388 RepID=A0A8K0SIT6_9HYPO|nr:RNA polymerase II transcription elongation factor-domain-containing protein [Stachybotrys elegans]
MAGLIDPTLTGKYPVILGDGLLGRTSNEIFTGIKYNHKPALSTGDAPQHARLKPSLPGKTGSYDLQFSDADGKYAYAGTRDTNDKQYVLYFDPDHKAFILDKVDSTFNMNLTRLPNNTDPDSLSKRFPHLEVQDKPASTSKPAPAPAPAKSAKASSEKANPFLKEKAKPKASKPPQKAVEKQANKPAEKPRPKSPVPSKELPKRKAEPKKKEPQNMHMPLSLPKPEPPKPPAKEEPKPKSRKKQEEEEEEDEDDDDGGLLIEYPGAEMATKRTDFSPAFPSARRFDEFMDQRDSEGDDADGESEEVEEFDFKLPSPVNHHENQQAAYHHNQHPEPMDQDEDEDDLAADLEKDLEDAFEDLANSQHGTPDGDESEISEED